MVNTICIDDLIPLVKTKKVFIKLDIEMTEATALSCAYNFFEEIDVRYVLMEWLGKSEDAVNKINKFMEDHGFKPFTDAFKENPAITRFGEASARNIFFIK